MEIPRREWPFSATAVALTGITIIALALRLPSFDDSLFGDEVSTNYVVNGFGVGSVLHIVLSDQEGTPPLFFWLTWLTKGFDGVEGLRVISLLAGLASIPLTYLLGARTVGRRAGLVGAALIAISPFQIFYATEARAYALVMLLCLLVALSLLMAVETGRARWWVAYAISMAAGIYTHYTVVFVLIGLFGWAFVARPGSRKPLLLSSLGAVVLYIPWIPELLDDRNEPAAHAIDSLYPFSFDHAGTDTLRWAIGHPYIPMADLPGNLAIWLMAAGAIVGLAGLLVARSRGGADSEERPSVVPAGLAFVLVLAVAAPVGAAIASFLGPSVFVSRNIIGSAPGLALAVGALATAGTAPWRLAAVTLVLGGFAIGAVKMLDANNQRPDYAALKSFVEETGGPHAPVVERLLPGPGPQTTLEAAMAPKGQANPQRLVLPLGKPTLEARIDLRKQGNSVLKAGMPAVTPVVIAAEASSAAGSGDLFLVSASAPLALLRATDPQIRAFLDALPPRFHEIESRSFPGLDSQVTAHVLSGA